MTPATRPTVTTRRVLRQRRGNAKRRRLWALTTASALGIGVIAHVGGLGGVAQMNATACTIAAAGDIAESGGGQAATAAIVKSLNPTAVLTLGDNAYPNGSSSDYASYYDPTWGAFKAITKPAPGNHEYYTPGGTGYLTYFGVKPYYAYDLCGWRMYALNKELSGAARTAEIAWYKSDLAANAGRKMLAVWHEPRWTSGTKHGSDSGAQDLWAASVAGGVDVVLSDHEPFYERLGPMDAAGRPAANGTREFVVGEGGNDGLSSFGTPLPSSEKRISGHQGVLFMSIRSGGYDFELHQIGGAVADRGSVSLGAGSTPTTTVPSTVTPTATR
jgi:acid phosphatase type 7